jgi:hypothetical protein
MTDFSYLRAAAAKPHNKYAAQLQEWLESKDFILGLKGISLGRLPVITGTLRHFKLSVNEVITGQHYANETIREELIKYNTHWSKACGDAAGIAAEVGAKIKPAMAQLVDVPLEHKREVLRYMQIIPTPIAAAYLGVAEHALNESKDCYQTFGDLYAGDHCYSLEELKLIQNNCCWIRTTIAVGSNRATEADDEKSLDQVVMVDEEVAIAFTGMDHNELIEKLPRNPLWQRPYRLSDLEKIRIAKLAATA